MAKTFRPDEYLMLNVPVGTVIGSDPSRALRLSVGESPEFAKLVDTTPFGSGALCYLRRGTSSTLEGLGPQLRLELRENAELVGTYLLVWAPLISHSGELAAVYRALLTVREDRHGQGLGSLLVDWTLRWLESHSRERGQSLVTWGCIEAGNTRSQSLLAAKGAFVAGELEASLLYRQWPRHSIDTVQLPAAYNDAIESAVAEACVDCSLRTRVVSNAPFVAVMDGESIVAGARVQVCSKDLVTAGPAWLGAYANLVRRIAPARRRFDPRDFRYLQLSDVVVRPEQAWLWQQLVPTLLAQFDSHMIMTCLDRSSMTHRLLSEQAIWGRFSDATRQRLQIVVRDASTLTNSNGAADLLRSVNGPLAISQPAP